MPHAINVVLPIQPNRSCCENPQSPNFGQTLNPAEPGQPPLGLRPSGASPPRAAARRARHIRRPRAAQAGAAPRGGGPVGAGDPTGRGGVGPPARA
eukprot:6106369-Pyramimonas_sp.AAC.2